MCRGSARGHGLAEGPGTCKSCRAFPGQAGTGTASNSAGTRPGNAELGQEGQSRGKKVKEGQAGVNYGEPDLGGGRTGSAGRFCGIVNPNSFPGEERAD